MHVVDARIPKSSFINDINEFTKNKEKILVFSKYDLCDKEETLKWKNFYEKKGYTVILSELNDKNVKNKIVDALTDFKVDIKDTKGYLDAQVTCGGVCLDEINLNDMSSKFVNNLYFIGEVLDLDGDCGGYNLTIAFITGLLAGGNND